MTTNARHPIARYRAQKGITLEAFGALVGVQKAAVHKWEGGGRPSPGMAKEIERATGIPKHKLRPDLWEGE